MTGTGHHRVQIIYFFWMQVAPRAPSGVGLVVGCRSRRIRHRCDSLVLPESLEANHGKKMAKPSGLLTTRDRAAATALLRALAPAPDRDAFAEASAAARGAGDSSALVALRFPAKPKRAAGDTKRVPLRERMAAARGN